MNYKEAKDLLQAFADFCESTPDIARAAQMGVEALDKVEALEAELRDERDRRDRYADYSVERDRMIDQLKEDLRNSGTAVPCDFCKHSCEPLPCETEDFICDKCKNEGCVCHACRDRDKWEWRGVQEAQ